VNGKDALIAELCPDGVPHLPLASVGTLRRGRRFVKNDIVEFGTPCIHYGEIYTDYGVSATKALSYLPRDHASRLRSAHPGDVIIASAGETIEDIGKAVAWLGNEDVVIHDACYAFHSDLNAKFVAYFLQTRNFRSQVRPFISTSKISAVSLENLGKVRIPVPPIQIQREIVGMLDAFSGLEVELGLTLEAELAARRRQYEYYRGSLLTFPEKANVAWARLGDVCTTVVSGGTPATGRAEYYGGDIPWVRTSEVDYRAIHTTKVAITEEGLRASSAKWIPAKSVIVAMIGATAAKAAFNEVPVTTNQNCCNLVIDPLRAHYKFVYYWLCREYENLRALAPGAVPIINATTIKAFGIPLPPLDEQKGIVAILEKFDALVNDLSFALATELNARRNQYEHYRDRLLTFSEAA
jgi:type I restriction enzyme S subunit